MPAITQSFYTYLKHTKRYYAPFFSPKSMVLVVVLVVGMGVLAAAANMVVTHAGVAQWLATDVLNETILKGNFDYMLTADAPEESDNRFHLQMPMMLEGFLPASNYVSNGTADPDRPKLDDILKTSVQPSFFNMGDFEMASSEEWQEAAADATAFLEARPPQSGLQ